MARATWCWRRWIAPGRQDEWIARLQAAGCATWTMTERPNRVRILLAVYAAKREPVLALRTSFGGQVRSLQPSAWLPKPRPPTRVGDTLEVLHQKPRGRVSSRQLLIPHGLAFGSGEHATTFMLLRALVREGGWNRVLDLGTGSGVLALAARRLGAKKIVAIDFDPDSVKTSRQNEALNFSASSIRWQCADVKKLRRTVRYDLVLANLFSGILIEASPQISARVAKGGQLWISGILRAQQEEVTAAYRKQGLHFIRATPRGKWVMLQWARA